MKRFLKGLEREWWRGMIEECEDASAKGRKGDMLETTGDKRKAGCEEYETDSG